MSNDTPNPIERASVEQADRELAAYFHECIWGTETEDAAEGHARLLNGERDVQFMIQGIARHRQQAHDAGFAEGLSRAASVADEHEAFMGRMKRDYQFDSHWAGKETSARDIATAIRALSAEANEGRCDG